MSRDTLRAGESLSRNEPLISQNGLYKLVLKDDGNLVVHEEPDNEMWNSDSARWPEPDKVSLDKDGNLFLSYNGAERWSTNFDDARKTFEKKMRNRERFDSRAYEQGLYLATEIRRRKVESMGGESPDMLPRIERMQQDLLRLKGLEGEVSLVMRNNGNAVIVVGDKEAWSSETTNKTKRGQEQARADSDAKEAAAKYTLKGAQSLSREKSLTSNNGQYTLKLADEGFEISNKNGPTIYYYFLFISISGYDFLGVGPDGSPILVTKGIFRDNSESRDNFEVPMWLGDLVWSGTLQQEVIERQSEIFRRGFRDRSQMQSARLVLQDDGHLQGYDASGQPAWSTKQLISGYSKKEDRVQRKSSLEAGDRLSVRQFLHTNNNRPENHDVVVLKELYGVRGAGRAMEEQSRKLAEFQELAGGYALYLQEDGNLVIWCGERGGILWQTKTGGTGACQLEVRGGNSNSGPLLKLTNARGEEKWSMGKRDYYTRNLQLTMYGGGQLVLSSDSERLWFVEV